MNISLIDVDSHNFPNLALMKISAWHKAHGDTVDWYSPLFSNPDKIYASKVFTFTPDYLDYNPCHPQPIKGGTGYDIASKLPGDVDAMQPDYTIYPQYDHAIGFLSRGCIRNCNFCLVRKKEGYIRQYSDIEQVAQGRKMVVLMDNNFLANDPDFVRDQLEKSVYLNLKIDFNQGLDCRLINEDNAQWLAKCKWGIVTGSNTYIRFSCDHNEMIEPCKRAISTMRKAGFTGKFFVYLLAKDPVETLDRLKQVLAIDQKINPFVMPFRDFGDGKIKDPELKRLARWCNIVSIRKSCSFEEYR
jgi:hypothetical protein